MSEVSDFLSVFDGPALVVTAQSDAGRSGCFVAFATQCSIYPPRLLVCLSAVNLTTTVASRAHALGVHVLRRDQASLASLFAEETGDDSDKLEALTWHKGLEGAPILEDCAAWLEGLILDRVPLGDHVGYLLEIIDVHVDIATEAMHKSDALPLDAGHPAEEIKTPSPRVAENLH